jgi:uncharacterized protein involved in exopolysaccharide biosynthesis
MEITLRDVIVRIWQERILVALTVCALLLVVIFSLLVMTPKYSSTMVVGPVESTLDASRVSSGGVSALLSGSQRVTPFQIYLKLYKSPELAEAMIRDHDIVKRIFADRWDAGSQQWRPRSHLGRFISYWTGKADAPTVNDLSNYLNANIVLEPGDGEEMQTIRLLDKDRILAQQILQWTHEEAEALTKARVQQRSLRNISYLNQKLTVTTQTEQRNALVSLLLQQENSLMAVQNWNAYSGDLVSGPWVSDRPVSPNPSLLILLALLGGVVIGCAIIFARMLTGFPVYRLPFADYSPKKVV